MRGLTLNTLLTTKDLPGKTGVETAENERPTVSIKRGTPIKVGPGIPWWIMRNLHCSARRNGRRNVGHRVSGRRQHQVGSLVQGALEPLVGIVHSFSFGFFIFRRKLFPQAYLCIYRCAELSLQIIPEVLTAMMESDLLYDPQTATRTVHVALFFHGAIRQAPR